MYAIVPIASRNAIGSLLPLSSSSSGRRFCLRASPFERRRANTEAESVEDITEARSSDWAKEKLIPKSEAVAQMKPPVKNAVSKTPTVASTMPGKITGLMSGKLVSTPPENRIIESDIMPMNWALE